MNIYQEIKSATPRFLKSFKAEDIAAPDKNFDGEEFVSKRIICGCGGIKFQIFGYNLEISKGLIFKSKSLIPIPPVYLSCEKCKSLQLLFDPTTDGNDGEISSNCNAVGSGTPVALTKDFSTVAVTYTYQGIENYIELKNEGTANIENYFDTIAIFSINENSVNCVVECECA